MSSHFSSISLPRLNHSLWGEVLALALLEGFAAKHLEGDRDSRYPHVD